MRLTLRHAVCSSASVAIVFLVLVSAVGASSPQPAVHASSHPAVFAGTAESYNWSGYAVTASTGSVTEVQGSWKVPAANCTAGPSTAYSSFWVGIDGYSSSTVEQTGTDSDCYGGSPSYYAWYEFYPYPSEYVSSVPVSPGDTVYAQVTSLGRTFTVKITDETNGRSYSTSMLVFSARQSSAEWIAEAPSSSSGILPLADFGWVGFGRDYTGVATTDYATINGANGSLASYGANVQEITMISKGGATEAQPSSLSHDGTSFAVGYGTSGLSSTSTTSTSSTSHTTSSTSSSTSTSTSSTSTTTTTTSSSSSSSTSSTSSSSSSTTTSSTSSTTSTSTTSSTTSTTSTPQTLVVTVSTNAQSYAKGSSGTISVQVQTSGTHSPVSGAKVKVTVTFANGNTETFTGSTAANGVFSTSFTAWSFEPAGTGTVVATVTASGYPAATGSTTFTLT